MVAGEGRREGLRYLHKAQEGRCDLGDGYGIRTAEMCGLPYEIVEEARALRERCVWCGNYIGKRLLSPSKRKKITFIQNPGRVANPSGKFDIPIRLSR